MTTFDVYFNSGEINVIHYEEGDNISLIEITNSDQDFFQTGFIETFNISEPQEVGDTVQWVCS